MKGVPVLFSRAWQAPELLRLKPIFPDTVGTGQGMLKFLGSSDTIYVPFLD